MPQEYLCISIPLELRQYKKISSYISDDFPINEEKSPDFGVKLVKDDCGNVLHAAYYSDTGELIKKIIYDGASVASIEHYRYNILYSQEKYHEGKITKKINYSRYKKPICIINYEYNRKDQIVAIRKVADDTCYEVLYGYDELMRVDSRTIKVNNKVVAEQKYRYDILDRIVEYKDTNQVIKVLKMNQNNELVNYTITDIVGNTISIINKYMCSEYLGSEIELNGHKTTVKDKSYVDNVMLKKPFTSEDDLDLVVSKMLHRDKPNPEPSVIPITQRKRNTDIVNDLITQNVKQPVQQPLPISQRKKLLLQNA